MGDSTDFSKSASEHSSGGDVGEVTRLLGSLRAGDETAVERIVELIYDELRQAAGHLMAREHDWGALQPTALVHEAFLKLQARSELSRAADHRQLLSVSIRAMRRMLIEVARRRQSRKRGGDLRRVRLDRLDQVCQAQDVEMGSLLCLMDDLGEQHERPSQVVTLRFLGGFSVDEVAQLLGVSTSTVEADFRFARAWLRAQMDDAAHE